MLQAVSKLITVMSIAVAMIASVVVLAPVSAQAQPEIYKLGLGMQSTGSACCLSVRLWNNPTSATELVATAARHLHLTVRGIGKIANTEIVDGYMGAGLALTFGASRPLPPSPIRALQLFMGVEIAVPLVPPQFTINVEGTIEMDINRDFNSYLGGGIHFNF